MRLCEIFRFTNLNLRKSKYFSYQLQMLNFSIIFYDLTLICPLLLSAHQSLVDEQETTDDFLPCKIKTNRDLIFLRAFSIFITMFAIHCKLNVVITSFFQTFFAQWALKTQYFGAINLFWIVTCQLTMLKASSTTTCPIKEGMKLDNSL